MVGADHERGLDSEALHSLMEKKSTFLVLMKGHEATESCRYLKSRTSLQSSLGRRTSQLRQEDKKGKQPPEAAHPTATGAMGSAPPVSNADSPGRGKHFYFRCEETPSELSEITHRAFMW